MPDNSQSKPQPPLFELGTQVVVLQTVRGKGARSLFPPGVVGIVVRLPALDTLKYLIRFMDGTEEAIDGSELIALANYRNPTLEESAQRKEQARFYDRIIYQCIIGSQAYGLSNDASDIDRRGIYLPRAEDQWSLFGVPEQIENEPTQEAYWEYQKFLILALKANPNALECLYSPRVERTAPAVEPLLANRQIFLSQLVYQTYSGYVASQFKKLQSDMRNRGEVKWKHAMHLIRLLLSGLDILRHQRVTVDVAEHRDELLAIRRGERTLEQIDATRLKLHKEFDRAQSLTNLPARPDYEMANTLLIEARKIACHQ